MALLCRWKNSFFKLAVGLLIIPAIMPDLVLATQVPVVKDPTPEIKFETAQIEIGAKKIKVEIAKTPDQHQKGLMYRNSMPANEGMLFIFDEEQILSFWMKNTFVDLSIAYIGVDKKIVDIQEMHATNPLQIAEPPSYPSKKPALYALEMTKGWFKKNKVKIGHTLKLSKNLK